MEPRFADRKAFTVMGVQVHAARYAVFECTMDTIGSTYSHIYETWLPASSYEFADGCADFEYYPPQDATDASTAVWIPIRERG